MQFSYTTLNRKIKIFLIVLYFLLVSSICFPQDERGLNPGIIHVHSTFSTGRYSITHLVELARKKGIRVLIMTDHNLIKLEYGISPFRGLIRKRINQASILYNSPEKYLKEIERLNSRYSDITIIPGCEVAPFYYWEGSLLERKLALKDWDRSLLLIGIDKPADFRKIPQIGNSASQSFRLSSILLFWPIALLIAGWKLAKYKRREKVKLQLITIKKEKTYRWQGYLLIILALLFLISYFPFTQERYSPYEGYAGYAPYQKVIDFANQKDFLSFWAHPESSNVREYDIVTLQTDKYPEALIKTTGYTGFSALYEGWRKCANPGGYWDKVLIEFLEGKRGKPVWCIGELDYHFEGEGRKTIDEVQTVFIVDKIDKTEILGALKNGRTYALRKTKDYSLHLEEFYLTAKESKALSGDTLIASEPPRIMAQVTAQPDTGQTIKVKLIRNGKVIKDFHGVSPITIDYIDTEAPPSCYYRLDISTKYPHQIFSNPIFFQLKGKY